MYIKNKITVDSIESMIKNYREAFYKGETKSFMFSAFHPGDRFRGKVFDVSDVGYFKRYELCGCSKCGSIKNILTNETAKACTFLLAEQKSLYLDYGTNEEALERTKSEVIELLSSISSKNYIHSLEKMKPEEISEQLDIQKIGKVENTSKINNESKFNLETENNLPRVTQKEKERINILNVLSGMALSGASVETDYAEAEAIFDAAREANSHFSDMSDEHIVRYCSELSEEQLNGMVSLVHGRYFENIVSDETGGVLFDAKNHEDTDMTLGGVDVSIKSNDATADSITDFETMSPQDLGMDDAELRERTIEVMDGDIIDATDALISGTVGFGSMAMLQAAGKSIEEWEQLSEYEKTNMRAAWIGAKATGQAAAGTTKSAWSLLKLAGKGLRKGYEKHKEFKDNGGYEELKSDKSSGARYPDYSAHKISSAQAATGDFFGDLFADDEPSPKRPASRYAGFRRKK